ncbi:dipeptidase D [Hydrogenispora ethanolica]|uniref:Dipeptidase D n=1 Tax=Hydrogenispora ethanolica TaxID=1082276 RepID=A0A4V2QBZ4_HYDET|nr:beta-Ala-His dipeptidase [Hydrogenispora ethanolica]TCL58327.1 dipeptidase D [Hydrogenispora ethanolica]
MSQFFAGLAPERVWNHFEAITKLPRGSRNEDAIRRYIADFAKRQGLECFYRPDAPADAPGERTVVVYKKAAPGLEGKPAVVLQAHMDMVCVPNDQIFPLRLSFCDEQAQPGSGWVKAGGYTPQDGTTLGADDGIGIAVALAILEDESLRLGPLEAFFTVQEEVGLEGARDFDPGLLKGRILINLDEEVLKGITYGCAGGLSSMFRWNVNRQPVPAAARCHELRISGLRGGHSGVNIHEGRANALHLLARILRQAEYRGIAFHLAGIASGNLRQSNVIPSRAAAVVVLDPADTVRFGAVVAELTAEYQAEYQKIEPQLRVEWLEAEPQAEMVDGEWSRKLVHILMSVPHGVQKMAEGGLVETSTNLSAVALNGTALAVLCMHRSFRESGLRWMEDLHDSLAALTGASMEHIERYPGWTPNEDSDLLRRAKEVYDAQFQGDYKVDVIHAGLESGWVVKKYPEAECIAIGPNLLEAHTVRERVEISSVASFYQCVLGILESYARD